MDLSVAKKQVTAKRENLYAFACGFLLSAAPLSGLANPFGIALLCAVRTHRTAVLWGCLAALPFCRTPILLQAVCLLGCFWCLSLAERAHPAPQKHALPTAHRPASNGIRLALCFGAALLTALGTLLAEQNVSHTVAVGALCVCMPLFCRLFVSFLQKDRLYDLSLLGCAFAAVQIVRPLEIAGVSLSLIAGAVITLCAAKSKGFAYGCAMGLLCGLTSGGAAMGALGVTGITFGLLCASSESLALVLSYMIAVSGYWYLGEHGAVLPAAALLLAACFAYLPFSARVEVKTPYAPPERALAHKKTREQHLQKYAAAFSSLSGLFYTVSESAVPQTVDETVDGVRTVVRAFCRNCRGCTDGSAEGELLSCFVDALRETGVVHPSALPAHLVSRCPSIRAMARTVNNLPSLRDKQSESDIRRMASEYANLSSILDHAARREEASRTKDRAAAQKVRACLRESKIPCDSVQVTGTRVRNVEVYGVRISSVSASASDISRRLSACIGTKLGAPEFLFRDDYTVMRLSSVPRVRLEYAKCMSSKRGEKVCGDTVTFFETDEGTFHCLLSDGMGAGRDAALSSRLAAIMLEKLLTVGASASDALCMVNKALTQKEQEVFATVDLLAIDRYTAEATLIKAGAAPTFLFRGNVCKRFESRTPPAGIMQDVIAEKHTFKVRRGDVILILSDGVMQVGESDEALPAVSAGSAHAVAAAVLSAARERTACADDMSVCAVRVY